MQRVTKFILLSAYITCCIVLGISIAFFSSPMCLREDCVKKSAFIILRMDPKADPCKNFYKFVCGKGPSYVSVSRDNVTWKRKWTENTLQNKKNAMNWNHLKSYEEKLSTFEYMSTKLKNYTDQVRWDQFLGGKLKKIGILYYELVVEQMESLCQLLNSEDEGTFYNTYYFSKTVNQLLHNVGIPFYHLIDDKNLSPSATVGIFEYHSRLLGFIGKTLFSSIFKPDPKNPKKVAFYLKINEGLKLKKDNINSEYIKKNQDTFGNSGIRYAFITYVHNSFPTFTSSKQEVIMFNTVVDFWLELSNITREALNRTETNREPYEIELDLFQEKNPLLDVKGYLKKIIGEGNTLPTHIFIDYDSMNYFTNLASMLKNPKYTRQILLVYMLARTIFDYAPILPKTDPLASFLRNSPAAGTGKSFCQRLTGSIDNGIIMSLVIERFRIKEIDTGYIQDMFDQLKNSLGDSLQKSSWMDKKTKENGKEKLKAMSLQFSISDELFKTVKTPRQRNEYFREFCIGKTALITIMSYLKFTAKKEFNLNRIKSAFDDPPPKYANEIEYNNKTNKIFLPIGVLSYPAFERNWPLNVNFGSLGTEIARNMIHGFDINGSTKNKLNLGQPWWTDKTYAQYMKKDFSCSSSINRKNTQNLKNFNSSTARDLYNIKLNNRLFEHIMSIKLALKAFLDKEKMLLFKDASLPGLEMYSSQQVFFLSHMYTQCVKPDDDENVERSSKQLFGAISSLEEFKNAFQCKNTDNKADSKVIDKCLLF